MLFEMAEEALLKSSFDTRGEVQGGCGNYEEVRMNFLRLTIHHEMRSRSCPSELNSLQEIAQSIQLSRLRPFHAAEGEDYTEIPILRYLALGTCGPAAAEGG